MCQLDLNRQMVTFRCLYRDLSTKFYVPSIEEFHVGFEYEAKATFQDGTVKSQEEFEDDEKYPWTKQTCDVILASIERSLTGVNAENGRCGIRVKYLDKEDIESLGFEYKSTTSLGHGLYSKEVNNWRELSKPICNIVYNTSHQWTCISIEGSKYDYTIFT